ncbi:PP2C family protein-serine/threonine phosphatase [Kribbella kalugense]|uniref:Stage II sporulation protein E n=1 Tax=Kribbella kalugense TaxID=2512221 RepID=A0A4R8A0P2_9ACTN|nr:PP2C family protein-serine/threonine phosphatase [Kribbella kalugense]TDW24049.1 stage II sporulation protein E [Kribbella kalugense]
MRESGGLALVRRIGRRVEALGRRARRSHRLAFVVLLLVQLVIAIASRVWMTLVPASFLIVPLVVGGVLLQFGELVALTGITTALGSFAVLSRGLTLPRLGFVLVLLVVGWILITSAKVRSRLGVAGTRSESMLMELRDTLTAQGEMPKLPSGWRVEVAIQSARGSTFSGDFVVSTMHGDILEVALVDVSGKGIDAGTRALLLSGAFGGLLGVVREEEFLSSANRYIRRQDWDDDFATVVHVVLDLRTGDFDVRTAGHPPAIHFDAWTGRWQTRDADGPLLGLMESPEFKVNQGQLKLGDALFLYSDGMVETPRRDIGRGTDRLIGHAERLVAQGFLGAAAHLVASAGGPGDDSAIVIIHRTPA